MCNGCEGEVWMYIVRDCKAVGCASVWLVSGLVPDSSWRA